MIRGHVNASRQAVIPLQLFGPNQQTETVEAVVDTGFDGSLTLSPELVARLELPFGMTRSYAMGDGRTVEIDVHRTTILWDGQEREVDAPVTSGGVLVGMSLLLGFHLFVDAAEGGEVRIQPRP
jgi:clan AA aspartic protease